MSRTLMLNIFLQQLGYPFCFHNGVIVGYIYKGYLHGGKTTMLYLDYNMAARTDVFCVVVVLIFFMIRIANRKSNDGVKIDLLRREESYSLCLLGEKVFGLLRLKVPKLPKKNFVVYVTYLMWRY